VLRPGVDDLAPLGRYIHLLVIQRPNKPAWKPGPRERIEWRVVTVLPSGADRPAAPAFSSLVKAVKFLQAAVLAGTIKDVNKVGKFPQDAAPDFPFDLIPNPELDSLQSAPLGPLVTVDQTRAISQEE